jgi:hypothetical protein
LESGDRRGFEMANSSGLVQELLETVQRRMETKVLERLNGAEAAGGGVAELIDAVYAEEQSELVSRAAAAEAGGEGVQAEMYRLMRSDLLPQAVAILRGRLRQP